MRPKKREEERERHTQARTSLRNCKFKKTKKTERSATRVRLRPVRLCAAENTATSSWNFRKFRPTGFWLCARRPVRLAGNTRARGDAHRVPFIGSGVLPIVHRSFTDPLRFGKPDLPRFSRVSRCYESTIGQPRSIAGDDARESTSTLSVRNIRRGQTSLSLSCKAEN